MSVSLWQHILMALALLTTNAATFFICKHRVEELKAALLAKQVLLGEKVAHHTSRHSLVAGETLSLRHIPADRIDIEADSFVTLSVVYFR